MKTHADKMHENKNKSAVNTNAIRETSGTSTFRFVDNRHEASQMRKLHEMANSSSRVKQLRAFKKLTHTSSQITQLQSVIQRQCDHCDNVACDDGSICNYNGRTYGIGQHGARRSEQQRLTDEFGQAVSGDTHQSEHYYGFAVLNETSGQSRRESGRFEREAHAYQEVHGAHRAHVGTGTSSTVGASGFSADTYRDDQRALLESGNPSAAGQLNTLGYAFQPSFQGRAQTTEGQQASSSFVAMMGQMQDVTYMQGTTPTSIPVSANDRLEQLAARFAVERGHNWPTADDIADARNDLGM